jgi:hypothetical protein
VLTLQETAFARFKTLCQHLTGESEGSQTISSVRIFGVPVKIRRGFLPNTSQKRVARTKLLGFNTWSYMGVIKLLRMGHDESEMAQ